MKRKQARRRTGGICPYHRAKFAASQAHILIVNHSLLLTDVASGNRVLPDFEYLIIDEAHHLEDATTNALSFRVTQTDIERTIREIGGTNSGLLGRITVLAGEMLPPEEYKELRKFAESLTDYAYQFQNSTRNFYISINDFLKEMRDGRPISPYSQQERVIPSTRTQPFWLDVEIAWEDAQNSFRPLVAYIKKIADELKDFIGYGSEEAEDQLGNLGNVIVRLEEYARNIDGLVFDPETDMIYWAQLNPNNNMISLNAAPLHIGDLMEEHVWHKKSSVILTSATLSSGLDDFSYISNRLNGEDAETVALGSPFDYESSTLLYLPNNIPEPNDRHGHQRALEKGIISLAKEIGGKTLVLFTSYTQLQTTSKAIKPALSKSDISVYEQGQGASPHSLLESFKNSDQAVLLGTRAFWEGVDVPGEALSALIIARLPFAVPSDPVVAARAETFEQAFYQYSIPEAILSFRQGFGRLIRSHQDRGVVAVFDRRILSKQYGKLFLDALPNCTKEAGPVEALAKKASQWLGF